MTTARPLVIETKGLSRRYLMGDSVVDALIGVDLAIGAGEFVAIVGPSGSGKSTLMYLLGCLDQPTAGSYRLDGEEVANLDDRSLSRIRNRKIGFVFQQFYLLADLDVAENVALGLTYGGEPRRHRRVLAESLAGRLGLSQRLDHRPNQLSGGQIQRVAVARALAGTPSVVFADEPTGNLDSHTAREILHLLSELNRAGTTVVLVTHDPNLAECADRVISIADGRLVGDRPGSGNRRQLPPTTPDPRAGSISSAVRWAVPSTSGIDASAGTAGASARSEGRLRPSDLLRISLTEGILAHQLRSALTMLGIIFAIAAVILMTAITEGGKRQAIESLRQIGMNSIHVAAADLGGSRLARERRLNPEGLMPSDRLHLAKHVPGVSAHTAWKSLTAELRRQDTLVEAVSVLGVAGDFPAAADYQVAEGRFPDALDEERSERVVALGPRLAADLGARLGDSILIGDQPFTVVGIMQRKAFTSEAIGDVAVVDRTRQAFVPYAALKAHFRREAGASALDAILLAMDGEDGLVERSRLVRHILSSLHRGADDITVSVPLEKLRQAQSTKDMFNLIIIVIAGISLVVGGIGIMNIMLAAVTERTREIGIRRAVGASRRDVLVQFLTEAALIAGCGGLVGILAGLGAGAVVQGGFGIRVAFSAPIAAVAAAVSMGVGLIFGLYPAWLAARKDPVEALRN